MNVSVVLPVFNAEDHLREALDSVLGQTLKNIEVISIDDGSTDSSLEILRAYSAKDSRLRVISRENRGLVDTLNQAITLCRSRYIARMDADDVCEPERLEVQLKMMQKNQLAVVGCSYRLIDAKGNEVGVRILPKSSRVICWLMDFGSPLCHPSVMFDKERVGKLLCYNPDYKHCEDLELWFRLRQAGLRFGNVRQTLFRYRVLDTSVSRKNSDIQSQRSVDLVQQYCDFVREREEAEYLVYARRSGANYSMIAKFSSRILRDLDIFRFVFVVAYSLR